jgi:IMP dehydrogenase
MQIRKALAFDDVLLVPQENVLESRKLANLETKLSRNLYLRIPIIAANMPTVCAGRMARALGALGGLGIIHRMQSVEDQVKEVLCATVELPQGTPVGVAVGVGPDSLARAGSCVAAGASVVCIDIAHGHDVRVGALAADLLERFSEITVIAGNLATKEAIQYLHNHIPANDVDRVIYKVGIGGGSVCTTRVKTGCGVPTLQSVLDVSFHSPEGLKPAVIADGGIRNSGDIVKSLAAGAHAVMLGSLLSGTDETPGEVHSVSLGGLEKYKIYRGAASESSKLQFYGNSDYVEGVETRVPYKGAVSEVVGSLVSGIQSGLAYCGVRNLEELRERAQFIEITSAGMRESTPHGVAR